jgi:hypothetical protein
MSSRRSPLGALLQGAYLHSAWPCTPPPATLLALLCVALGSPMLACSSVGDTGEIASSSSASLSGADDTTGSLSSDSNPSGQGESTGGAQGGTDDDPGGIDTGSDSGGESTGAAPELPAPEPVPEDILETAKSDGEGCDLVNPISVTLRTVDASATVSPTQARDAALSDWVSLTGIRIRPWEFFNYYAFSYAPAEYGALSITPQLIVAPGTAEDKSNSPEFILQIGVTTHALPAEQRPPVRLTLALDNSNSMSGKAQDMLRATGKAIAANLRQGDVLSIVTWNAKNPTILELHDISGPSDPVVLKTNSTSSNSAAPPSSTAASSPPTNSPTPASTRKPGTASSSSPTAAPPPTRPTSPSSPTTPKNPASTSPASGSATPASTAAT